MLRVVSDGLWPQIKKLAHGEKIVAATAYVTSDRALRFGKGDVLVCDASDIAIQTGQTSVSLLRAATRRGADVYSSPGLHAKAMVVGRTAIVGSANMSESSASQLVEAAVITDDARAVAGVRILVEQLKRGADLVDKVFLARISQLKVRAPPRRSRRRKTVRVRGPRAWFISVTPLEEERYAHEDTLVASEKRLAKRAVEYSDSEAGYIRWSGNASFRTEARPGDLLIQVWTPTRKARQGTVYAPTTLLRRRDAGKVTHFFAEEYADEQDSAISFTEFKRLWVSLGGFRALRVRSTREVPVDLLEAARSVWPTDRA